MARHRLAALFNPSTEESTSYVRFHPGLRRRQPTRPRCGLRARSSRPREPPSHQHGDRYAHGRSYGVGSCLVARSPVPARSALRPRSRRCRAERSSFHSCLQCTTTGAVFTGQGRTGRQPLRDDRDLDGFYAPLRIGRIGATTCIDGDGGRSLVYRGHLQIAVDHGNCRAQLVTRWPLRLRCSTALLRWDFRQRSTVVATRAGIRRSTGFRPNTERSP